MTGILSLSSGYSDKWLICTKHYSTVSREERKNHQAAFNTKSSYVYLASPLSLLVCCSLSSVWPHYCVTPELYISFVCLFCMYVYSTAIYSIEWTYIYIYFIEWAHIIEGLSKILLHSFIHDYMDFIGIGFSSIIKSL